MYDVVMYYDHAVIISNSNHLIYFHSIFNKFTSNHYFSSKFFYQPGLMMFQEIEDNKESNSISDDGSYEFIALHDNGLEIFVFTRNSPELSKYFKLVFKISKS